MYSLSVERAERQAKIALNERVKMVRNIETEI